MLSKRLRFRKNRQSRRQIALSDLLISEALEKRQMLSATPDNVFYDIELLDEHLQPVTWQQPSWLTPNSYSAPWTIDKGQNGSGIQSDWTSNNNLADSNGFLDLKEDIIHTIEGFKDALSKGHVKEVSDDLIGVLVNPILLLMEPLLQLQCIQLSSGGRGHFQVTRCTHFSY